jgi:hypothetical protein
MEKTHVTFERCDRVLDPNGEWSAAWHKTEDPAVGGTVEFRNLSPGRWAVHFSFYDHDGSDRTHYESEDRQVMLLVAQPDDES